MGFTSTEWTSRLGKGRYLELVSEGELSPSLDAWENVPPEISTHVGALLTNPRRWLGDMVGGQEVGHDAARRAAQVANATLYRWWNTGPGVPGPGTLFVAHGSDVRVVHVNPAKVVVDTVLWDVSAGEIEEYAWSRDVDNTASPRDEEEHEAVAPAAAPPALVRVKRSAAVPLGDAAVVAGLPRPTVTVNGATWELEWPLAFGALYVFGELGRATVHVVLVDDAVDATFEHQVGLTTANWGAMFAALAAREREQ